ncbi:hypothetical protein Tco_0405787, partial [Tanacetum coccineum]
VEGLESELKQTKQTYSTALTKLILRVKKLEQIVKASKSRRRARVVESDDEKDLEDPSKQGRKIIEIDQDPSISLVQDEGTSWIQEDIQEKIKHSTVISEVSTAAANLVYIRRSAQKRKDKGKAIMQESEPPKKVKKRVQVQMSMDEELAKKVFEEEQAKAMAEQEQERINFEATLKLQKQLDEREEVAAEPTQAHKIDWSDPAVLRYHAQLNIPYYVAKVRKNMVFEKKGSRKKSLARKRAGEKQSEESTKRQKIEDDIEKEELKAYLDLVPREEFAMEIESLATKYPIVDWKTHVLTENFMYYQIFRADRSFKNYKIFSEMLDDFDRQDLLDLHRLVKARIHILLMDNGIAIYMMIEKKYPLTQEMLSKMLSKKLEVDHESTMAYELLRTHSKSRSAVQRLLAGAVQNAEVRGEPIPTLPFVTSSVSATPEREDEAHTDSATGLNLRTIGAPPRFVISSDSSHHSGANIAKAEVDSFGRPSVSLMTVATTVTSTVDPAITIKENFVESFVFGGDSSGGGADYTTGGFSSLIGGDFIIGDNNHTCREIVDEFAPPKFFASIRGMEHDQLFIEFNVGTARQMSFSSEVRMRAEYNIREKRRLSSTVEEKDSLLNARYEELESLKAQLLVKEAEAAEAIRLHAEASKFEVVERSLQDEVKVLKEQNAALEQEKTDLSVKVADLAASVKVREQEVADLDAQITFSKCLSDNFADRPYLLLIYQVRESCFPSRSLNLYAPFPSASVTSYGPSHLGPSFPVSSARLASLLRYTRSTSAVLIVGMPISAGMTASVPYVNENGCLHC